MSETRKSYFYETTARERMTKRNSFQFCNSSVVSSGAGREILFCTSCFENIEFQELPDYLVDRLMFERTPHITGSIILARFGSNQTVTRRWNNGTEPKISPLQLCMMFSVPSSLKLIANVCLKEHQSLTGPPTRTFSARPVTLQKKSSFEKQNYRRKWKHLHSA